MIAVFFLSEQQHSLKVLILAIRSAGCHGTPSSTFSRFEASGMSVSHSSFKCSFPLRTSSRVNHCRESKTVQPKTSWIRHANC